MKKENRQVILKKKVVEKTNKSDYNYLSMNENKFKLYLLLMKEGFSIFIDTEHYKNIEDKKSGKVNFFSRRKIIGLEKMSYRDKKREIYRIKLFGEVVNYFTLKNLYNSFYNL